MTTALALPERRTLPVVQAGTNHGAHGNLPYLRRFHEDSDVIDVEITAIDPDPTHVRNYTRHAADAGLRVVAREAKVEDIISELPERAPLLVNVDNPAAHARVLRDVADSMIAVLGGLYAVSPDGHLLGIRYVFAPTAHEEKRRAARLFADLDAVTGPGGRERVFGERGRPEHLPQEAVYRDWQGTFVEKTLAKLAKGVRLNHHPIELTRDGRTTLPVVAHESVDGWERPHVLATEAIGNAVVLRGEGFIIAEHRREGVRFHFARLGKTDGRIRVNGYAGFDRETLDAAERAERERQLQHEQSLQRADLARQQREVTEALRRAEQQTVTRRRPFFFTD